MMGRRSPTLTGPRWELTAQDTRYPDVFRTILKPPEKLYGIGERAALQEGLAIVGARKATPYGRTCAARFARLAAERGVVIISGGARGCDAASHEAALQAGGTTVVFLGGGCDRVYPAEHSELFQRVIEGGGAVVSEQEWDVPPMPYMFRARNRLIAGLARATLIVEAGLPSGTFSTADEALEANREVLVVPGAITSPASLGANRLLCQGATPIVDDDTFYDQLFCLFGCLKQTCASEQDEAVVAEDDPLACALQAQPLSMDELLEVSRAAGQGKSLSDIAVWVAHQVQAGRAVRYADGRYGPMANDGRCPERDRHSR